jgi:hypothetical protein
VPAMAATATVATPSAARVAASRFLVTFVSLLSWSS